MFNAGTSTPWLAGRWAAGFIFLIFGVAKFSGHAAEVVSFRRYSLSAPDVFVYLAGSSRSAPAPGHSVPDHPADPLGGASSPEDISGLDHKRSQPLLRQGHQ
jgi:hypothetical protein